MRTKISFHRNENNIHQKFVWLKVASVDCEILLIVLFFFLLVSSKDVYQSYDFSRKSLSKYLMDTIDFNKHDIDIFINLTKIVRYGKH